jgi:uncharacterized coiled-coil protein SlyX
MENKSQLITNVIGIILITLALYFTTDSNDKIDQQRHEIENINGQIHALSEKSLADQESNLKDLEENKKVEKRVTDLEIELQNQRNDIDNILNKLLKPKTVKKGK